MSMQGRITLRLGAFLGGSVLGSNPRRLQARLEIFRHAVHHAMVKLAPILQRLLTMWRTSGLTAPTRRAQPATNIYAWPPRLDNARHMIGVLLMAGFRRS